MKLRTVEYDKSINAINLIDQRNLPFKLNYINCHNSEECATLIKDMATRGAGAIGAMAAYGMAQAIIMGENIDIAHTTLLNARPTAVDLKNGIDYVYAHPLDPYNAAQNFVEGIVKDCEELKERYGVEHKIITDNSAASLMAQGKVDLIVTGADRVCAKSGHAFNKIGTYSLAVLAEYHDIPFYIAAPKSTLDKDNTFDKVVIEERNENEVKQVTGETLFMEEVIEVAITNKNSKAYNQAFDCTPPELITGYITPIGIVKADELLGIH
jgi:methylthioribose-1-phosphate isomerase